ncbi:tyrosine-type recombinase/integrase [Lysinibacillus sp. 3P01SB]|uniref:tyrosine-type recombinase/integrase n=1 Tax=Lysinibacillus sp. 3P01SB TaxID=3132284 RepID=UPI0039A64C0B
MADHYTEAFRAFLIGLNKSQHTIKQYVNDAKQFEKFLDEESYRESFSEGLKAYIHHLHTKYTTANSINRKLAALRSYLEFLYSRKYIKVYDETLLESVAKQHPKLVALTDKELRSVLNCWHQMYSIAETDENAWLAMRNLAITYTIAMLGIKPAELVKMKWSHINEKEMTINIMERLSYRTLEMPSDLLSILLQYKKETEIFFSQLEEIDEMWLGVGNKLGEPITVKTVERIFLQLSKLLDFKVTCTNLRYTVIEMYMKQQEDDDLFAKFGYARKGVLIERHKRLLKEE